MKTDTPRTDACPHCGANYNRLNIFLNPCDHTGVRHPHGNVYQCGTSVERGGDVNRSNLCLERKARQKAEDDLMRTEIEMQLEIDKAEAEVAFWKSKAYEAEEQEGKREMEVEKLKELVKWYENRHSTIIST